MTNADWWARVVHARTQYADLLLQRVWVLRKDGHEAAIDLRRVPGVGAEIVLSVDGEWRPTRLFRAHEQAELSGAIADRRDTRACPVVPASGTIPTPKLTPPAELLWEYQQCVHSGLHPIQQRVTSGMHPIAQNFWSGFRRSALTARGGGAR